MRKRVARRGKGLCAHLRLIIIFFRAKTFPHGVTIRIFHDLSFESSGRAKFFPAHTHIREHAEMPSLLREPTAACAHRAIIK